jgi:hypothetical protein
MSSSQVEISKIEINPNRLREFSKLPLPDFAIGALLKNGFSYEQGRTSVPELKHDGKQPSSARCKLSEHFLSVNTHIDSDGPRLWQSSAP